ncbi:MAG: VPLPA-CTERM-specific exosortase XrtD [Syntrophotaleaceae bacterium]
MLKNWRVLALVGGYGILFALLYRHTFPYLLSQWDSPDFNYCYLVPLVVAYLIWDRRDEFNRVPATVSWWGLLVVFPGLGLFWLGELGGEYFTLFLSLWLVAVGLLWLHLGGAKLKTIRFPLLLSLAMFPPPNLVASNLSLQLKLISSKMGVIMMQLMGMTAYREGNVIDLGFTRLQVVDACSGLRYLFPIIILGLILAYMFRGAWWKKAVLVLSTVPLVVLTNGLRIAATGFLFQFWGPAVAEGFFHDFAGWFTFMFVLGVLVPEMMLLKRIFPDRLGPNPAREAATAVGEVPGRALPLPAAVIGLLLMLVTVAAAQGIDFREKTPVKQPLAGFPLRIGEWQGIPQSLEQKYIDALDFSDYLLIDYRDPRGSVINLYIAYYETQRKGESIHSPSSCLPGDGWVFNDAGLTTVTINPEEGRQIRIKRAIIEKGDYRQLTYYWFPQRGRILTGMAEMKLFNFWDALIYQRTDGSLVRLITPVSKEETVELADRRLQEMTRTVVQLLDQYLPGKEG